MPTSPFDGQKAIKQLQDNVFPAAWSFVPVAGKATFVKKWATQPLDKQRCIAAYKEKTSYNGVGVVTGKFSDGLIALDIDGFDADKRYRAIAGDEYETFGEEQTMAWTSGFPGRRQLLYRIPTQITPELEEVKTIILNLKGTWELGTADVERKMGKEKEDSEQTEYEEVVLRFNQCQSVLPGSVHPDGGRYSWLSYNNGMPKNAPGWLLDAIRPYRKPVPFLSSEEIEALSEEVTGTLIPPRQIRGWFWKDHIQEKLRPRLRELIFNQAVFDDYGWRERHGEHPQMMSGCPWHGGQSGTAFQVSTETGCWDCKACGVHGDVLDYVHKIKTQNKFAGRPTGLDLEAYVANITSALGYSYPEDAKLQVVKSIDTPRIVMSEREFHEALIKIHDEELNPALRLGRMAGLATETGRRLTGQQCLAAMDEYRYYETSRASNRKQDWWQDIERMTFIIPNLLMRPTQVMLHSAGGLGKTSACMGLATAIGRGRPMKIRGITLPVQQGSVLWIQNDQNPAKLLQDCEDNGINPSVDKWFIVKRGFQLNHTHEFAEWVKEYRPALIVVDSIGSCSTKMQVEEKDKAFASPFYYYSEQNGAPDGFPATSIVWIHHDNARGGARGTLYLTNAVDEQWHLRSASEEEKGGLRERGLVPSNCRFLQIKKSRLGREGDLLVVERDQDFAYSVWDYTPTERREDQGQGDPEPNTMALRIVKDRVNAARSEAGDGEDRMSAREVWERLVEEMAGQGRKGPSLRTVQRWLERWVTNGVLVEGKPRIEVGSKKPSTTYSLPHTRALSMRKGRLSLDPRERLVRPEKTNDKERATENVVVCSDDGQPVPESKRHRPIPESDVVCSFPVTAGDLGEAATNVNDACTKGEEILNSPAKEMAPELGHNPEQVDSNEWSEDESVWGTFGLF